MEGLNQPFDFSRSKVRGLPFDKLKAPSTTEWLRVDTEPFDFPQGHEQVEWQRLSPRPKRMGFGGVEVLRDSPFHTARRQRGDP